MAEKLKEWLLGIAGGLPIWRTSTSKGRKRDEPNKGEVFVITHKRVWFFGWVTLVIDVRFEDEALNARIDQEYADTAHKGNK